MTSVSTTEGGESGDEEEEEEEEEEGTRKRRSGRPGDEAREESRVGVERCLRLLGIKPTIDGWIDR